MKGKQVYLREEKVYLRRKQVYLRKKPVYLRGKQVYDRGKQEESFLELRACMAKWDTLAAKYSDNEVCGCTVTAN